MKRLFLLAAFSAACLAVAAQPYWNQHQRILPLRAPVGERPEFMDLNGDGRQDAVKSYIAGDVPILWLDEDGNMAEGALEGDTVNDCLLVDRDKDGAYDFIVKFADLTGNGVPDMQLILDYPVGGRRTPNFMYVFDDDKDGVLGEERPLGFLHRLQRQQHVPEDAPCLPGDGRPALPVGEPLPLLRL